MAGKWKVSELTPTRVDTPDGSISVSWVNNFDGGVRERKAEAVARLIAAAPDLLEALIELRGFAARVADGVDAGSVEEYIEQADAAITRATQPLPPPNEESK